MKNYKILPPLIKRGIYQYNLIKRIGMIALYAQCRPKTPDKVCGYAVVRIRKRKPCKLPNGTILPYRETFPSPSRFGHDGWFYMKKNKEIALAHLYELSNFSDDNIPPKKTVDEECEDTTHFSDEDDFDEGDGIVA